MGGDMNCLHLLCGNPALEPAVLDYLEAEDELATSRAQGSRRQAGTKSGGGPGGGAGGGGAEADGFLRALARQRAFAADGVSREDEGGEVGRERGGPLPLHLLAANKVGTMCASLQHEHGIHQTLMGYSISSRLLSLSLLNLVLD